LKNNIYCKFMEKGLLMTSDPPHNRLKVGSRVYGRVCYQDALRRQGARQ
jgi:hypothetical protein